MKLVVTKFYLESISTESAEEIENKNGPKVTQKSTEGTTNLEKVSWKGKVKKWTLGMRIWYLAIWEKKLNWKFLLFRFL